MKIDHNVSVSLAFALALMVFLCGCYVSKIPMASSANSELDPNLIGKWERIVTEKDPTPVEMLVLQFNDNEYYAEYRDANELLRFRAYIVKIEEVPFINVQDIKEDRSFIFVRYSVGEDGVLTLRKVSEDFVKSEFETSEALYEFIKNNMNEDRLYDEADRFKRATAS